MASFRRLPSGKWQATVRRPDGKRETSTDTLKRTVQDWANEREREVARGKWRDPRMGRVTVKDWSERWMTARVVEPETHRGDSSMLKTHILTEWSRWQLAAITPLEVQRWVRERERAGAGAQAIRRAYNLLRTMLGAAVLEGLIESNPCDGVALPRVPDRAPVWFTHAEAGRILEALGEPHRTMTAVMLWCGLRWSEAAGLRVGAVCPDRGTLSVTHTLTQNGVSREYGKSSTSRRDVPVPAHVMEMLAEFCAGRDPGALVFTTRRQSRPLTGSNWRTVWDGALVRAGVPLRPPHVCRHTAASWLVQDGVPLYDVQRLLGHSSFAITQKYAHLAPDAHAPVTDAWARIIGRQTTAPDFVAPGAHEGTNRTAEAV